MKGWCNARSMLPWTRLSQTFDRRDLRTGDINEVAGDLTRLRIAMAAHPAYDHAVVHTQDEVHTRCGED